MNAIDFSFGLVLGFATGAWASIHWALRRQEEQFARLIEQIRCAH